MKDCRKSQQNTDTVTATCHDFTFLVPQRLAKSHTKISVCRTKICPLNLPSISDHRLKLIK